MPAVHAPEVICIDCDEDDTGVGNAAAAGGSAAAAPGRAGAAMGGRVPPGAPHRADNLAPTSPEFLISNSRSHMDPLSALAELVDNAKDAGAKKLRIDATPRKRRAGEGADAAEVDDALLELTDDGGGLCPGRLQKALGFGFSHGHAGGAAERIGRYGNGLKSSSMKLGACCLVVSACGACKCPCGQCGAPRGSSSETVCAGCGHVWPPECVPGRSWSAALLSVPLHRRDKHEALVVPLVAFALVKAEGGLAAGAGAGGGADAAAAWPLWPLAGDGAAAGRDLGRILDPAVSPLSELEGERASRPLLSRALLSTIYGATAGVLLGFGNGQCQGGPQLYY